ncbi:hypothetical protein GGF46_003477 [Coemansia sp. RSA 552]|nr:hypothetical protein GGF46_003477 [Coemansia sp. RSA 552]
MTSAAPRDSTPPPVGDNGCVDDRQSAPARHAADADAMASSFLKTMSFERASSDRRPRHDYGREDREPPRPSRSRHRSQERSRRRGDYDRDDRRRDFGYGRDRSRARRRRSRSRSSRRYRSRESRRPRDVDVVPLHLRPKKLNLWDLAPQGFENVACVEAKASGMFPPPGQSAGSRNVASFNPSVLFEHTHRDENDRFRPSSRGEREFPSTAQRQARRLYVGNIPYGVEEDSIATFFNELMVRLNIAPADELPVQNIQINHDKNYAFVEFRNADQATMGMGMDGVMFQGQKVKIRRPKDYIPPVGQPEPMPPVLNIPGVMSHTVPDSPNKVYVGGLPTYLTDEQVMELLRAFGELKSFNLVKDTATAMSRGFAFCEYADPGLTDVACQGLNGMEIGDRHLVVQRASVGSRGGNQPPAPPGYRSGEGYYPPPPPAPLVPPVGGEVQPTPVVQLLNMVTAEELMDDAEYADILDDVRDECATYGTVVDLAIPRNTPDQAEDVKVAGVGKIFVKFGSAAEASAALAALAGRQFMGRTVIASYITEQDFADGNF